MRVPVLVTTAATTVGHLHGCLASKLKKGCPLSQINPFHIGFQPSEAFEPQERTNQSSKLGRKQIGSIKENRTDINSANCQGPWQYSVTDRRSAVAAQALRCQRNPT